MRYATSRPSSVEQLELIHTDPHGLCRRLRQVETHPRDHDSSRAEDGRSTKCRFGRESTRHCSEFQLIQPLRPSTSWNNSIAACIASHRRRLPTMVRARYSSGFMSSTFSAAAVLAFFAPHPANQDRFHARSKPAKYSALRSVALSVAKRTQNRQRQEHGCQVNKCAPPTAVELSLP